MSVFLKDLLERAGKTFAQTLVSFVAVGVPIFDIDWTTALGVSATATIASALTSLASKPVSNNGTASLVPEVESRGRHRAPE